MSKTGGYGPVIAEIAGCLPNYFPFLLEHAAWLRFPASLAVKFGHATSSHPWSMSGRYLLLAPLGSSNITLIPCQLGAGNNKIQGIPEPQTKGVWISELPRGGGATDWPGNILWTMLRARNKLLLCLNCSVSARLFTAAVYPTQAQIPLQ